MPRPDGEGRTRLAVASRIGLWLGLVLAAAPSPGQEALERGAHARLMARIAEPDSALVPFTTDGCSGGMSEVWAYAGEAVPAFADVHGGIPPWEACCEIHDRAYHDAAGAREAAESYAARLSADQELRACVRATAEGREAALGVRYGIGPEAVDTLYRLVAAAMYRAVRVGGGPCTGLPWRWGYGWPEC
jgi:hypothetical protein